jgi:hypothetical protein
MIGDFKYWEKDVLLYEINNLNKEQFSQVYNGEKAVIIKVLSFLYQRLPEIFSQLLHFN